MIRANLSGERCNDVCSEYDEVYNDNSPLENYMNCENMILSKKISVIWDISAHLCDIWRPIGRVLFNNESILTNIEEEYCNEIEREKAYQMLLKWSRQHGQDATLKKLLDVLFAMKKDEIVDAIILQVNDAASPKPSPSCSERAKKLEEKSRAKWQKNALKNFKKTLQLYEERLQEMERVQQLHFITKEAQEIKDSLRDIDRNYFAEQLARLHAKIEELEYSGQRCSFREQQLRVIADQFYKLDKTLGKHCESLGELRVLDYQQVECAFAGFCVFRYTKIPIGRQSRRYSNSKDEEVSNDDEKKICPHIRQEEHTRRKLRVSITDDAEQSQLSEFVAQFCQHYQQNRPFAFEHCLFNGISPGSRSTVYTSAPPPLSIIDPNTLPTPRYQSSEVITDLFTRPKQTRHLKGWVNDVSVWI